MAYECTWKDVDGSCCHMWTPEDSELCSKHQPAVDRINKMWKEVNGVIQAALKRDQS